MILDRSTTRKLIGLPALAGAAFAVVYSTLAILLPALPTVPETYGGYVIIGWVLTAPGGGLVGFVAGFGAWAALRLMLRRRSPSRVRVVLTGSLGFVIGGLPMAVLGCLFYWRGGPLWWVVAGVMLVSTLIVAAALSGIVPRRSPT